MEAENAVSTIGIVAAKHRPEAMEWACMFATRFDELGLAVRLDEALVGICDDRFEYESREKVCETDLVVVLGGDGTLLSVARIAGPAGTLMMALDVGSLGFLAKARPEVIIEHLDEVVLGAFEIDERLMLKMTLIDSAGKVVATDTALNDIVVSARDGRKVVSLRAEIDGEELGTYRSDGLIVSTPTGSTGYTLSAGGPIVDTRISCLILTAICPHTLSSRPLVLPEYAHIRIEVPTGGKRPGEVYATGDGQVMHRVCEECAVIVTAAPTRARLVRLRQKSYFANLVDKLMPGMKD